MTAIVDQDEVLAFLGDGANYGLPGSAVERIDTHISAIFLVANRAYKLKRAVTLPFLDFASVAARELYCRKEIAINCRSAPMLYLGLHAITRSPDGGLDWDGDGATVDWVIEMARFDQDKLFDRLATAGQLHYRQIEQLADVLVRMHDGAEVIHDHGGAAGPAHVIATNDATYRRFVPDLFSAAAIDALSAASTSCLQQQAALLERRRREGMVRRCHGDLHLGNICLIDERPVPFDAIEFNEEFACIDRFYDLSFLVMDFDRHNLGEFAALLLSRTLAASNDFEALAALQLFLSLRAAIRGHVAAAMGQEDAARDYVRRAMRYLAPPPPRLVAVGGLSGSGKSLLSRRLAPLIGAVVLRSDVLRKHLMGVAPETRLPPEAYLPEVTERVYHQLLDQAERALRAGHSVIIDAVSARPGQRRRFEQLAGSLDLPFTGLWLEADGAALKQRVEQRRNNASDATTAVVEAQLGYDLGEVDWIRIDSSGDKDKTFDLAKAAVQ